MNSAEIKVKDLAERLMMKRIVTGFIVTGLLTCLQTVQIAWSQAVEPDYTKGETLEGRNADRSYCSLGPIGAIGNLWGGGARMIQIRTVMEGTPAAGVLEADDVILGVISPVPSPVEVPAPDGKSKKDAPFDLARDGRFDSEARKAMASAITEAEKKENGGKLVLNVWRPIADAQGGSGKTRALAIAIPVLGRFSDTSPWQCPKTAAIVDAACRSILDRGLYTTDKDGNHRIRAGIAARLEVLGLLATGEERYLPVIQTYVRTLADALKEADGGFHTWNISYETLLLTEYYLATKDAYVLPAIRQVAVRIAEGASDGGTFSHGSAYSFMANGQRWKYPSAYGAMNQCSITSALALVLARKCGVENDEVDSVIGKAATFYRWYVDKGAIPYGDHPPVVNHDNNGVNSQAAVLFDLLGDKEAASYFTRSTLASYMIREQGHTGHFFSFQWGALGAARGGDQAAQSFIGNTRWFTELERRPDGTFIYQPALSNAEHGKYRNWSTTGSRLLQYCLPRKQLYITGKGGFTMAPIAGDELKRVVSAGEFDPQGLTVQELLAALSSWSPVVRGRASEALGEREENVVEEMIAMLDSEDRYTRYGAAEGLSYAGRGSEEATDALVKKLDDDDLTLRYYAACAFRKKRIWQPPPIRGWKILENTLAMEGGAIDKAIPALLKQAAIYEPQTDPMRKLHDVIASTLFYGGGASDFTGCLPNGRGVENLDRSLLIPAVKSLLKNPNGGTRTAVSAVFSRLTEDDLKQLWGDIYYATKYQAPSGSMAAGGVRGNGLKLMVKKGVEEGIPLGIDWALRQEGWGNFARKRDGIPTLLEYGGALEDYVPEIDAVLAGWTKAQGSKNNQENAAEFKQRLADALKQPAPRLKSIKPYIDATPDPLAVSE